MKVDRGQEGRYNLEKEREGAEKMVNVVYSIGYSGFTVEEFTEALKENGVMVLVDVRSSPYSAYHTEYDREALAEVLRRKSVIYRNYARQFGARQENRSFLSPEGYLDFEKFAASEQFREGVRKVKAGMGQGYVFCFMCAETDPMTCHRAILVTRAFSELGYEVIHLLPGHGRETQEEMERRMVDKLFPDREQLSLFGDKTDEDWVKEAYKERNRAIGFRPEEGM